MFVHISCNGPDALMKSAVQINQQHIQLGPVIEADAVPLPLFSAASVSWHNGPANIHTITTQIYFTSMRLSWNS